ncbi:hypothetical protein V6N13_135309 [Hibiscus sabdariffa]
MSASPDCDIVGRWGESLDDFSEDEENIVPITEDDDVHLLDVDDVEAVMAVASEENGLDVEDDVWNAAVARLGSGNTQPVWGYVGPQTEQSVPSYTAYEPPTSMYDVDYTAMRDREHEARVFGSSSSSNYGELAPPSGWLRRRQELDFLGRGCSFKPLFKGDVFFSFTVSDSRLRKSVVVRGRLYFPMVHDSSSGVLTKWKVKVCSR